MNRLHQELRSSCTTTFLGRTDTKLYLNGRWVTLFRDAARSAIERVLRTGKAATFEQKLPNGCATRLRVTRATKVAGARMQVEVHNESNRPMTLGPLHLLDIAAVRPEGAVVDLKVFVDSGGGWWAGAVDVDRTAPFREQWGLLPDVEKKLIRRWAGRQAPPDRMDGFHNSIGGISVLVHPPGPRALVLGFLTFNRAANNIAWLYRKDKDVLRGWAGCDFAGFTLAPGERIKSETLFIGFYSCPLTALENYAREAAAVLKPRFPAMPPLGWCSWYAYRLTVTEELVVANAQRIKEKFPGYDFKYIQVDHGWQYKDICGKWTETNERFPHGLPWLSERLGKMGYRLGLWLGIFTVLESAPMVREHPEYLLKDKNGRPKVMPYRWSWEPRDRVYCVDPTHPGAQRFMRESLRKLRRDGARYWKFDFTWGIADSDANTRYHDAHAVKGAQTYRKGLQTLMDAVGNDYVYWCSNPINLGFGLGATSMTGSDIGNTGFSRAQKVEGRTEDIAFFRMNASTVLSRWFLHKRLMLLNPDVVQVGPPGTYEEGKMRLTLVAMCGGQVFLGDDLTKLSDKRWDLLAKCIPPYGKAARPVDLFEHTHPGSYPHIWHLPVRKRWGRWEVVAVMNLTEGPLETEVAFSKLGLNEGAEHLVFEFWGRKFLGKRKGGFNVRLKPVSTQLFAVRRVPHRPVVLSTDMHVTQGAVELSAVTFDRKRNVLSGNATRRKGDEGRLFIYLPEGYSVSRRHARKVTQTGRLLTLPLRFKTATVKWSVAFRKA